MYINGMNQECGFAELPPLAPAAVSSPIASCDDSLKEVLDFTAEQVRYAISMAADHFAAGFRYERHLFDEAVDKMHSIYEVHPEKRYSSKHLTRTLELTATRCGEDANSADRG